MLEHLHRLREHRTSLCGLLVPQLALPALQLSLRLPQNRLWAGRAVVGRLWLLAGASPAAATLASPRNASRTSAAGHRSARDSGKLNFCGAKKNSWRAHPHTTP